MIGEIMKDRVVFLIVLAIFFFGCFVCPLMDNLTTQSARAAEPNQVRDMRVEQVKIFDGEAYTAGSYFFREKDSIESAINIWLSASNGKIEIVRVLQSQGEHANKIVITIFYKKTE